MLIQDYFGFVVVMLKAEFNRIQRILKILFFGAALVFSILNVSSLVRTYITLKYTNATVLAPQIKHTQNPVLNLNYALLPENIIHQIQRNHPNSHITLSNPTTQVEIQDPKHQVSLTLNIKVGSDPQTKVHPYTLEAYKLKLGDVLIYHATMIQLDGLHSEDGFDLVVPASVFGNLKQSHDNFLRIETTDSLQSILKEINTFLLNTPYEYQIQNISLDQILLSLISLIERILLVIGFVIFLISASNLGTIMPYFIMEFEDEMMVLKHHGLKTTVLRRIFILISITMLMISLLSSITLTGMMTLIVSLILKIPYQISWIKVFILFGMQLFLGVLTSHTTIKKTCASITY